MYSVGLFLGPTQYRVRPHTRIYRCYNCKQLGNLAKTCPNNARYVNCGLEWTDERTVQNLLRASTLLPVTSSKIQSLTVHINSGIHYSLSLENPTPKKDLAWILTFSFQIIKISMSIQARIAEVALLWNNLLHFLYYGSGLYHPLDYTMAVPWVRIHSQYSRISFSVSSFNSAVLLP